MNQEEQKDPDPKLMSDLAFAFKLSRDYELSGELYERTAQLSKELESSCYMEGAEAWNKQGDKAKTLAAAQKAHEIGPDNRAQLGLYRWHRTLGEIFLAYKMKEETLHHLQAALDAAPIDVYRKQLTELIAAAKSL